MFLRTVVFRHLCHSMELKSPNVNYFIPLIFEDIIQGWLVSIGKESRDHAYMDRRNVDIKLQDGSSSPSDDDEATVSSGVRNDYVALPDESVQEVLPLSG